MWRRVYQIDLFGFTGHVLNGIAPQDWGFPVEKKEKGVTVETPRLSQDAKAILAVLHEMQADARRENDAKFEAMQKEMLAISAAVKTGFPGGDFDGHRRYHELVIEREEQRKQFWNGLLLHIAKTSTWAMLAGVFIYLVPLIGANLKEWLRR